MTRLDKINTMIDCGYRDYTVNCMIKHNVSKTAFVQSAPQWLQDIADCIIYHVDNDTIVVVDSYGRQLHTPVGMDWYTNR